MTGEGGGQRERERGVGEVVKDKSRLGVICGRCNRIWCNRLHGYGHPLQWSNGQLVKGGGE